MSEWMWKIYLKFLIPNVIVMNQFVAPLITIFHNDNRDVENFFHPLPMVWVYFISNVFADLKSFISKWSFFINLKSSLPWNQTTYLGYFAELILLIPLAYGYMIINGTFLLLFISICMHHQVFYKMFKHSTDGMKKCNRKFLCDSMRFHILAKK